MPFPHSRPDEPADYWRGQSDALVSLCQILQHVMDNPGQAHVSSGPPPFEALKERVRQLALCHQNWIQGKKKLP